MKGIAVISVAMLEVLALSTHLLAPPTLEWSARKRMLRERIAQVVTVSNTLHDREDKLPRLVLERLPGLHGTWCHERDAMKLDLESLHDARKFWHVYEATIPHEWAHHLNDVINESRGHGDQFGMLMDGLSGALANRW